MALIANVQWIWPPNYDGNHPEIGGFKKVTLHLTARCDTDGINTDETDVVKLDISELRKSDGVAPTRLRIESLKWSISGFDNVLLEFDRAPDATIAVMSGEGEAFDIVDESDGTDLTGDLLLTTYAAAAGSNYDITLTAILK